MKKILLNLGILCVSSVPLLSLVSCSSDNNSDVKNKQNSTKGSHDIFLLETVKVKFIDAISKKTAIELNNDVATTLPSANQLGLDEPTLPSGVVVTYSINSNKFYDNIPKLITVTLKLNSKIITKKINLEPKYDIVARKAYFNELRFPKQIPVINAFIAKPKPKEISVYNYERYSEDFKRVAHNLNYYNSKEQIEEMIKTAEKAIDSANKYNHSVLEYNEWIEISNVANLSPIIVNDVILDGHGGYWVGGENGRLIHLGSNMKKIPSIFGEKKLLDGSLISAISLDGNGGVWFGGTLGYIDHLDADGNLISNNWKRAFWPKHSVLDKSKITTLLSDGNGGVWVGGAGGKLDHITFNPNDVTKADGWTTKTLLDGSNIDSIISDGHDGLWVGGEHGKLDHIDSNGQKVSGWTTKTVAEGYNILFMKSDGHGGVWAGGQRGRVSHIGPDGNSIGKNWKIVSEFARLESFASDGNGGLVIVGDNGAIMRTDTEFNALENWHVHIISNFSSFIKIFSISNGQFLLFTTDGKIEKLILHNPYNLK